MTTLTRRVDDRDQGDNFSDEGRRSTTVNRDQDDIFYDVGRRPKTEDRNPKTKARNWTTIPTAVPFTCLPEYIVHPTNGWLPKVI